MFPKDSRPRPRWRWTYETMTIRIRPLFIKAACFQTALALIRNIPRRYVNLIVSYKPKSPAFRFEHVLMARFILTGCIFCQSPVNLSKNLNVIEYVRLISRRNLTAQICVINKSSNRFYKRETLFFPPSGIERSTIRYTQYHARENPSGRHGQHKRAHPLFLPKRKSAELPRFLWDQS